MGIDEYDIPADPDTDWAGFSGAAVLLADSSDNSAIWVYGVAQRVPVKFKKQLDVARLELALQHTRFCEALAGAKVVVEKATEPINIQLSLDKDARTVHGLANPYLGLRAFTFADQASFAGRERIVTEAVAWLTTPGRERTLLFISGPSGSGKSSLAQAGLLPELEEYYLHRQLKPRSVAFRSTDQPLDMLADALVQLGLPRDVMSNPQAIIGASQNFTNFVGAHTPGQQVNLVVIDQFEELMTQAKVDQRAVIFEILSNLAPFRLINTHFIITFRSDYLGELFYCETLFRISKEGLELRAMSQSELEASARRPFEARAKLDASYRGKMWDPDLVSALAEQAAASATYLPLFQLTLEEIWRGGDLSFAAYRRMGGTLASAIRDRATRVLEFVDYDRAQPEKRRSDSDQNAILRLLLDLVEVPVEMGGRRDVRRRRIRRALLGESAQTASYRSRIQKSRTHIFSGRDRPIGSPGSSRKVGEGTDRGTDRRSIGIAGPRSGTRLIRHFPQKSHYLFYYRCQVCTKNCPSTGILVQLIAWYLARTVDECS